MANHQSAIIEYERTFLLKRLPEGFSDERSKKMIDIYFPENLEVHPRLRLRQAGDTFQLTKKVPLASGDASAHSETTISLDATEFSALAKASTRSVEKTRYYVVVGGRDAELDVFEGKLSGLALLDFEFESKKDLEEFNVPNICLADVTQENFIAGGLLAGRSFEDIENQLERFGYVKI